MIKNFASLKDNRWRVFNESLRLQNQKTSPWHYWKCELEGNTKEIERCRKVDEMMDGMLAALKESDCENP